MAANLKDFIEKLEYDTQGNIINLDTQGIEAIAIESAINNIKYSQATISNHKVSSCLIASRLQNYERVKSFLGANIELSHSKVYHAEEVALIKAISEGFIYPITVVVTSNSEEQLAALCGYCRQTYMYINPDVNIIVVDMKRNVRLRVKLIDTMKHAYMAKYNLLPVSDDLSAISGNIESSH